MSRRVPPWLVPLACLLAILALPFIAKYSARRAPRGGQASLSSGVARETLVILTPHNEAIRHEFTEAFAAFMAGQGRQVQIDWRSPGGGSEINRLLAAEYAASFERYWTGALGRRWSSHASGGFAADAPPGAPPDPEAAEARRAFLDSNVGCGIDLLFGGGSVDAQLHASAGRLVDAGVVKAHPQLFGDAGIPAVVGGEAFWDRGGRWLGVCLSGFGICVNRDVIARLGVPGLPSSWSSLADPLYFGQLGLADPGKSGTAVKTFEMIIQEQMQQVRRRAEADGVAAARLDDVAVHEGWLAGLRLIRRLAANARYFSDAASRVPVDVATGDAAAGMCIDFYGRFQSDVTAAAQDPEGGRAVPRMDFVMPKTGTSIGADTIGLLRGAPHRELAVAFIEFVLSEAGQKIWSFRKGAPGGPRTYALQRLPILPALYAPQYDAYRADRDTHPYAPNHQFVYHEAWTGPLFRAIAFVVRVMCVDPAPELRDAYQALAQAGFPPEATALFDDVSAVAYETVKGPLRAALRAPNALDEVTWSNRLVRQFRDQYREVVRLARQSQAQATQGGGAR